MRNKYDLLKAVAILLLVLGHVTNHWGCDSWPHVVATFAFSLLGSIVLTHIVWACHLRFLIGEK